jgi:hypothetical protein
MCIRTFPDDEENSGNEAISNEEIFYGEEEGAVRGQDSEEASDPVGLLPKCNLI